MACPHGRSPRSTDIKRIRLPPKAVLIHTMAEDDEWDEDALAALDAAEAAAMSSSSSSSDIISAVVLQAGSLAGSLA